MKKKNALFIYNEIPDKITLYSFPLEHELIPHLKILQGKCDNSDDEFSDDERASAEFLYARNGCFGDNILTEFEISPQTLNKSKYEEVYFFTFFL